MLVLGSRKLDFGCVERVGRGSVERWIELKAAVQVVSEDLGEDLGA